MKTSRILGLASFVVFTSTFSSVAIEGLKISVQGTNAVLSWPSKTNETYIIRYRPDLNTNTAWVLLTNSLTPAANTNKTFFTHKGVVLNPTNCATGTNTSGGPPAPPSGASFASPDDNSLPVTELDADTTALLASRRIFPPYIWDLEQRPPAPWELEARFPVPWELGAVAARMSGLTSSSALASPQTATMSGADSTCAPTIGFYQVVRSDIHLFGITNGQVFSGLVSIPVEIGLPSMTSVPMEVALAPMVGTNDTAPSGVEAYAIDETNVSPVLTWDTVRTTNGSYMLQAAVTLVGDTVVTGAVVTVVVSNRIQMPKINDVIVSGLPIYAIIDQASTNYTITISNAQGQLVRTLTGQSTNYIIKTFWNGLNSLGTNVLTNHTYFNVTVSFNPSYSYRVWVFLEDSNLNGHWLIAYQTGLFSALHETQYDTAMQQVSDYVASQGLTESPYLQISTGSGDWTQMKSDLAQSHTRNLYYWGHGGPSRLGFGPPDSGNGLNYGNVRIALNNILSTNLTDIVISHAFRFVWLDGCRTGTKSSYWPRTFGIIPVQLSAQDFLDSGGASRAFLGWKSLVATSSFDANRFIFAEDFFNNWTAGQNLSTALRLAAATTIGTNTLNALQIWGDPLLPTQ